LEAEKHRPEDIRQKINLILNTTIPFNEEQIREMSENVCFLCLRDFLLKFFVFNNFLGWYHGDCIKPVMQNFGTSSGLFWNQFRTFARYKQKSYYFFYSEFYF